MQRRPSSPKELCTCGHRGNAHVWQQTNPCMALERVEGEGNHFRLCDCNAFDPVSETPPRVDQTMVTAR